MPRLARDCVLVAGARTKPTTLDVPFRKKYVLRAFSFFDVYLPARNILTRMMKLDVIIMSCRLARSLKHRARKNILGKQTKPGRLRQVLGEW